MDDVMRALRPYGLPVAPVRIRERAAYHQGLGAGRTAQEIEPQGPAACEITSLWSYVEGLLWPAAHERDEPLLARSA
jgi:chromosome partitioning protein